MVSNIIHTTTTSPPPPPMATATLYTKNDQPVEASPVAVETRSMYVVIPTNAGPGSVLTVVAPNGTKLSVVCPSNAAPGSQILVNY
eukprot:CAMPEP_0170057668 /NCGR_PEP_ID=MMETSP0019_2-20121128/579_1 /TAXON_ID=98059 /ORGANISM="Dinobryon sp., Strain UTEXLB2267" /LENGTH=85 /DNA_ID=CAMNT_0010262415 /DNA_START=363 /DNA_END=620 /DNA_ORIENTATION=+